MILYHTFEPSEHPGKICFFFIGVSTADEKELADWCEANPIVQHETAGIEPGRNSFVVLDPLHAT